jgi:hypothetical protein
MRIRYRVTGVWESTTFFAYKTRPLLLRDKQHNQGLLKVAGVQLRVHFNTVFFRVIFLLIATIVAKICPFCNMSCIYTTLAFEKCRCMHVQTPGYPPLQEPLKIIILNYTIEVNSEMNSVRTLIVDKLHS